MSYITEKNTIVGRHAVYGSIYLKLFVKEASTTCNNSLKYINKYGYKDFHFFRTVTMPHQSINKIEIELYQGDLCFERHLWNFHRHYMKQLILQQ